MGKKFRRDYIAQQWALHVPSVPKLLVGETVLALVGAVIVGGTSSSVAAAIWGGISGTIAGLALLAIYRVWLIFEARKADRASDKIELFSARRDARENKRRLRELSQNRPFKSSLERRIVEGGNHLVNAIAACMVEVGKERKVPLYSILEELKIKATSIGVTVTMLRDQFRDTLGPGGYGPWNEADKMLTILVSSGVLRTDDGRALRADSRCMLTDIGREAIDIAPKWKAYMDGEPES